jgi:predicted  nucleic acid-binding Zn-ribbon protein
MPHQCTDCGRAFDDGSKEMLSGCPDCGGTTFQFQPEGGDDAVEPAADPPEPPTPAGEGSVAHKVGQAATTVRDLVGSSSPPESESPPSTEPAEAEVSTGGPVTTGTEDDAQASARSELVSPDELPAATVPSRSPSPSSPGDDAADPADGLAEDAPDRQDRPDLDDLREELNDQFESIKVIEPGQYELNLMELYDREEYIIALQEDGKYTIQVPDRWKND